MATDIPPHGAEPNPLVHVRALISEKQPRLARADVPGPRPGIAKKARDEGEPPSPFERIYKRTDYYRGVPSMDVLTIMARVIECSPEEVGLAFMMDLYGPLMTKEFANLLRRQLAQVNGPTVGS